MASHSVGSVAVLTADDPLWAWAYHEIGERAEGMLSHLEGVRLGEDIEAVHDMRVGSRRLVAAMRVFAACFPDRQYRALLREAQRVTRLLGAVRDLDVILDYYRREAQEAPPAESLGIRYLLTVRAAEHRRARRPMLAALEELARSDYPGRLRRYLRRQAEAYSVGLGPAAVRGIALGDGALHGELSFRSAAPLALLPRHQEFYSWAPHVPFPDHDEQLHEMRISAKWFRYTMELFAPAYSGALREELSVVKRYQELLGDLHDSDVRLGLLDAALAGPLQARGLEALSLLRPEPVRASLVAVREREREVRARCYRAFFKEWQRRERAGFREKCAARVGNPDA